MLEKNKTKDLSTKEEERPAFAPKAEPTKEEPKKALTPEEQASEAKFRAEVKEAAWRKKREDVVKHEMRTRIIMVEMLNNQTEVMVAVAGARADEGLRAMKVEDGGCYEVEYRAYQAICQYAEAKHFKFITLSKPVDGLKPVQLSPKE